MSFLWKKQKNHLAILFISLCLGFSSLLAEDPGVVQGKNGMVATAHPLASEAALKMLKMGGNFTVLIPVLMRNYKRDLRKLA